MHKSQLFFLSVSLWVVKMVKREMLRRRVKTTTKKKMFYVINTGRFGSNNKRIFWVCELLELRKRSLRRGGSIIWLIHTGLVGQLLSGPSPAHYMFLSSYKQRSTWELTITVCKQSPFQGVRLNTILVSWQCSVPEQKQTAADIWVGGARRSSCRLPWEEGPDRWMWAAAFSF